MRSALVFRQADIAKALKAAQAAGLKVVRTEITEGKITLFHLPTEAPLERISFFSARRDARPS